MPRSCAAPPRSAATPRASPSTCSKTAALTRLPPPRAFRRSSRFKAQNHPADSSGMARSGIDKRRHQRHPRRLQCKLVVDSRAYSAFVLDLSVSGLFIQTHAKPRIGLRLPLLLTHARPPLEL